MEAVRISLDDYVLSGGGANGESYDHRTDPGVMLKLYFPGKIQQPYDEMMMARKVYALGIPTPKPADYVVTEPQRSLENAGSDSVGLGWRRRFCTPNTLPDDAGGLRTTL